MGQAKNAKHAANERKGSRGTVRNDSRLQLFADRGGKSGAGWDSCDPKWLQIVVVGITRLGGAITFGLSRDLGAHSLTLLLDDSRETLWFNGSADLDHELAVVATILEDMGKQA